MLQQYITVCTLLSDHQKYNRWMVSKVWAQGGGGGCVCVVMVGLMPSCWRHHGTWMPHRTRAPLKCWLQQARPPCVILNSYQSQVKVKIVCSRRGVCPDFSVRRHSPLSCRSRYLKMCTRCTHRWKGILTIEHPTMHCKEKAWALPKTWRKEIRFFFIYILLSSLTFLHE